MPIDLESMAGKAYTVEELAATMGVHPDTIRRAIRQKRLRAVRPPGSGAYMVLGRDAIRYIEGKPPAQEE